MSALLRYIASPAAHGSILGGLLAIPVNGELSRFTENLTGGSSFLISRVVVSTIVGLVAQYIAELDATPESLRMSPIIIAIPVVLLLYTFQLSRDILINLEDMIAEYLKELIGPLF